jgi:hypothetical protein
MHLFAFLLLGDLPARSIYLDPGSGSYLLQILIAAILGSIFVFKSFFIKTWRWLLKKFGKKSGKESRESINPD